MNRRRLAADGRAGRNISSRPLRNRRRRTNLLPFNSRSINRGRTNGFLPLDSRLNGWAWRHNCRRRTKSGRGHGADLGSRAGNFGSRSRVGYGIARRRRLLGLDRRSRRGLRTLAAATQYQRAGRHGFAVWTRDRFRLIHSRRRCRQGSRLDRFFAAFIGAGHGRRGNSRIVVRDGVPSFTPGRTVLSSAENFGGAPPGGGRRHGSR